MNVVNQEQFHINQIDIVGENRAAFIIKKKINRYSSENSKNKINISIKLDKNKNIEEKNIQNKVTKFRLSLSADVTIIDLSSKNEFKRVFNANQVYDVENKYSNTVNNSKEANNILIDRIINEILDQLKIYYG
tara:strand:+ start:145 stop:543 length:399 start_codon:yes stop_codon:yes gene_type:complete